MVEQKDIDYSAEIIRKGIHLCSLSIPIIYYFITRDAALTILIPITTAFLAVDLLRYYHPPTAKVFYRLVGWMLRSHEQNEKSKRLNGATNVFISATICVVLFPKLITITAFAILIISDSSAALIGRRWGKHRFFKKSVEGSLAFFLTAILVTLVTPKLTHTAGEYLIAIGAAAFGTVVEALSITIDDNLSIPLSIGSVLWVFYLLFYPTVNLSVEFLAR